MGQGNQQHGRSQSRPVCAVVCRLRTRDELGVERILVVGERPATIGRAENNDLVLLHESVSRHHVRITHDGNSWSIEDLKSKNGLKINGYETRGQPIHNEDRVEIGTAKLRVEIAEVGESSHARVVFDERQESGSLAEVLDMDRLDSLFGSSTDLRLPPDLQSSLVRAKDGSPSSQHMQGDAPVSFEEAAGLLGLFSQAAEALLTCDTLDETLERILELVFKNLTAERGVICLYDEETETTEPKVARTREGVPDEPIVISTHIVNDCIKRRQALVVQDAGLDARFGGAESIIAMSIRSAMCAPLYREGRVVGFVYVDQQSELLPFTGAQLQTLSTLAILSAVAVEQAALRDSVRHEQEIRSRLARYSSPGVVERVIRASGLAEQGMVAEEAEITVLFADLTGFTAMSENLHPKEVVEILNEIFGRLTEDVFDLDGTLDKFRGDGMMAFFGAPLPMEDHATRAVECALRMQERLADYDAERDAERRAANPIAMRIGVNSGLVVVGDIGSPQRKDYTVIGDVVNTASRLESAVATPGQVVIGHATYLQVRDHFLCRELPAVRVKGKQQPVRPYLAQSRLETGD